MRARWSFVPCLLMGLGLACGESSTLPSVAGGTETGSSNSAGVSTGPATSSSSTAATGTSVSPGSTGEATSTASGTSGGTSTSQGDTSTDDSTTGEVVVDDFPQRLVIIYFGHGAFKDMLVSGGPGEWSLGPVTDALSPFQDRAMFVSGVSVQYPAALPLAYTHTGGIVTLLTGTLAVGDDPEIDFFATGTSLDRLVADQLGETPLRALNYIAAPGQTPRVITWHGGEPTAPLADPVEAFGAVFSDVDFSRSPQLETAVDQLSADVDAFRSVAYEVRERDRFRLHARAAALALQADLTRVVTLQLGTSSPAPAPWLGTSDHHYRLHLAHAGDATARDEVQTVQTAWMEEFATFVSELDSVKEGNDTLLDNTVVVILSEDGDLGTSIHQSLDLPVIILGGVRSGLRMGEFVQLTDANQADLGLSIAQAVGANLESFGTPELDGHVLDELFVDE